MVKRRNPLAATHIVCRALALRAVVVRLVERARAVGGRAVVADAVTAVVVPEAGGDGEGVAGGGGVSQGSRREGPVPLRRPRASFAARLAEGD